MSPPPDRTLFPSDDRFTEVRESMSLRWRDGAVLGAHQGFRQGWGARKVLRDGTVVFTSEDSLDPQQTEETGEPALEPVRDGITGMLAYLEEVRKGIAHEAGEGTSIAAEVTQTLQRVTWEGRGERISDVRNGVQLEISAYFPNGGRALARLAAASLEELIARDPGRDWGRRLARGSRQGNGAPARIAGVFPVVFAAGGCEPLLHEIGHLFEDGPGRQAPTIWKTGARLASHRVTIVDDPRERRGRGSYQFDDEGREPDRVVLVDRGRAAERIRNGRRASYRDLPIPRMACTYLEAGVDDPRAILSDTRDGVLVRRLGTGSVDPESGRVTLSVTDGFLIEAGRATRPLAPSLLIGDVASMLGSIDAVGSDLTFDDGATNCVKADQQLPVIVGLPTIRIGMISVISP